LLSLAIEVSFCEQRPISMGVAMSLPETIISQNAFGQNLTTRSKRSQGWVASERLRACSNTYDPY